MRPCIGGHIAHYDMASKFDGNEMRKTTTTQAAAILRLRHGLKLNQTEFWNRLGITQSGGSRYESGRRIPRHIQMLIELAYGNNPLQALKRLRGEK